MLRIALVIIVISGAVLWYWKRPQSQAHIELVAMPTAAHQPADCAALRQGSTLVLLVLGQSNAGNHGQTQSGPVVGAFSYFDGRCYQARDPLPGASGSGGSVWSRLAVKLLQAGRADRVLLVPIAVNASSIHQWNHDPKLVGGVTDTLKGLKATGFSVDMVLWHQGEAESFKGTSAEEYLTQFATLLARLRAHDVTAPIWVAQATRCQQKSNDAVRTAQARLPGMHPGVLAGPDMDALFDDRNRFDGCHFSDAGLEAAAQAWFRAIGDYVGQRRTQ